MRFDLTFHADSTTELQDALRHLADTLPTSAFGAPTMRGFRVEVTPSFGDVQVASTLTAYGEQSAGAETDAQPAPLNVKSVEVWQVPAPAPPRARRTRTPAPTETEERAPDHYEPAAAPTSPPEAKLKALEILRECYLRKGGDVAVKQVQADFGGVKFANVPDEKGIELYDRAIALQAQLPPKDDV